MRRSRLNYIKNMLITNIVVYILQAAIGYNLNLNYYNNDYNAASSFMFLFIITIIGIVVQISLTSDRLRDMDKNPNLAWLVILPFAWLYFAIAKGTEGENQYGPSPKQLRAEENAKQAEQQALTNPTDIDLVLQKLEINVYPPINKVESINFHLSELDERLFYQISPENVKKLRKRLEILADRLQDNEISYGHKYAERRFYIGEQVIFSWRKEIKL